MGLFGKMFNAAKNGINSAKQKQEDAYYEGLNYFNDMCFSSMERDNECLRRDIDKFEEFREEDMMKANGYLMAAKKIIKNEDNISDVTIVHEYERCKHYGLNYARKIIVEPEMLKRNLAERDDSGRIIPTYENRFYS